MKLTLNNVHDREMKTIKLLTDSGNSTNRHMNGITAEEL